MAAKRPFYEVVLDIMKKKLEWVLIHDDAREDMVLLGNVLGESKIHRRARFTVVSRLREFMQELSDERCEKPARQRDIHEFLLKLSNEIGKEG